MKTLIVSILVLVMTASLFAFAGCDKEGEVVPTQGSTTSATTTSQPVMTTIIKGTTTTTQKPTTTTTVKTTDKNDKIAAQMMQGAKVIEYFVDRDEPLLVSGSTYLTTHKLFDTFEDYKLFVYGVHNWVNSVAGLSQKTADNIKSTFGGYDRNYFENNALLIIEMPSPWQPICDFEVEDICINGGDMNIYIYENSQGMVADDYAAIMFIDVPDSVAAEIKNINIEIEYEPWDGMIYKPVIYLYPEQEMDVCVKLGYEDRITVSYPEYVDGWSVLAKPDGKLVYNETGRNLYSLYYESENVVRFKVEDDGFVVKGEDTVAFLEEKLAVLGLNEYEAEEFIIYWLPILQANEYNYIRFATADEIERNMPLEINPCPDTIIRVIMTFKGLDAPIEVTEQELITPERTGFVAVEWGGTQIN